MRAIIQKIHHEGIEDNDHSIHPLKVTHHNYLIARSKIMLPTIDGHCLFKVDDIESIQADDNVCILQDVHLNRHYINARLKELEDTLSELHFHRIHKSHIINLHMIKKIIKKDGVTLLMENNNQLAVSRSQKVGFMQAMKRLYG